MPLPFDILQALNAIYRSGGTQAHIGLGDTLHACIEEQELAHTLFLKTTGENSPSADISWAEHAIKDISSIDFVRIETPDIPAYGHSKLYVKEDGRAYLLDNDGLEYIVNVQTPAVTVDSSLVCWDGLTGISIKDSGILVDPSNNLLWPDDVGSIGFGTTDPFGEPAMCRPNIIWIGTGGLNIATDRNEAAYVNIGNGLGAGTSGYKVANIQVVGEQQSTIANVTIITTESASESYTSTEQDMLNHLKADTESLTDQLDAVLTVLRAHGLIASS